MDKIAALSLKYDVGTDGIALAGLANGLAGELGIPPLQNDGNELSLSGITEDHMISMINLNQWIQDD